MKKYLALLAIAAVFGACQNEKADPDVVSTGEEVTEFGASIPEVDSKTYLSAKDGSVWHTLWGNGDAININGVASNALSTGDGYVGTGYARFTMKSGVSPTFYYAYPAGKVSSYNASNHTATVTIPTEQTWVSGQYDPNAYVMVGSGSSKQLTFHPLMGLLKISPTAPAEGTLYVEKVRVEAIGGEKLSGAFTTNYSALSGGTESYVEVIPASRQAFGTPFTAVIPAQTYAEGLRVSIYANTAASGDGTQKIMVFSKQSSITVDSSTQIPLTAPEFKESAITLSAPFKTSSSVGFAWTGANNSNQNNFKKTWRLAVYSDSGCNTLVVQHDIPADPTKEGVWSGMSANGSPHFIVGGLSAGTTYYAKVTDIQNNVSSPVFEFSTDSFTVVPASSPVGNTLVAEDFSEFGWGPAYLGGVTAANRYAGWSPVNGAAANISFAAPSGVVTTGYYKPYNYSSNQLNTFDYSTAPRFNAGWGYCYEGGFAGFTQAGHLRVGSANTNRVFIVCPALGGITSGKFATVDVTVKVAHMEQAAVTSNPEFSVFLESGLTLSNASQRMYTGATLNRRYPVILTSYGHQSEVLTFRVNGLRSTDHLMVGAYNNVNEHNRYTLYNIKVEKVSESSVETFDITDVQTLELFHSRVAGGATSLNGNVVNDIDASSIASSWTPLAGYTGTLSGNNKTITGLTKPFFADLQGDVDHLTLNSTINATTDTYGEGPAIFAQTLSDGGSLSYCTSKGSVSFCPGTAVTSATRYAAGLVAYVADGSVTNCINEASVSFPHNSQTNDMNVAVGGVVGIMADAGGSCSDLTNSGNVTVSVINGTSTARWLEVGGVVGDVSGASGSTVSNLVNNGQVSFSGTSSGRVYLGGAIGWGTRTISSCTNSRQVSFSGASGSELFIGGVVGFNDWSDPTEKTISGSNSGAIVVNSSTQTGQKVYIGGVVGQASGKVTASNSGTLTVSRIGCTEFYLGGIVAMSNKGAVGSGSANSSAGTISVSNLSGTGNAYIGGIVGRCWSTGDIRATNSGNITLNSSCSVSNNIYIGGIVGHSTRPVRYCTNNGAVTNNMPMTNSGKILSVGGIAGYNSEGGVLQYNHNTASVSNTADSEGHIYVGGISAQNIGYIDECDNTGNISNSGDTANEMSIYIGGVTGNSVYAASAHVNSSSNGTTSAVGGTVSNSGSSSGHIFIGGLSGYADRKPHNSSYNKGEVSNTAPADSSICMGGLIGKSEACTYVTCYNSGAVANSGAASSGGTGIAVDMMLGGLIGYLSGDNTLTSTADAYNYNAGTVTDTSNNQWSGIGGIAGYNYGSGTDLTYVRNLESGDLSVSGNTRHKIRIGGILGVTHTALTMDYANNAGDLDFENITIMEAVFIGGVLGCFYESSAKSTTCSITGCVNSGDISCPDSGDNGENMAAYDSSVSGWSYVGGITGNGECTNKTLTNCVNTGDIIVYNQLPTRLGGIMGYSNKCPTGSVVNVNQIRYRRYNPQGNGINGTVGGICGYLNISTFSNLTFTGELSTNSSSPNCYTGGLIGRTKSAGTFSNCKVGKSGKDILGASRGKFAPDVNTGAGLFVSCGSGISSFSFPGSYVATGTKCQGTTITASNLEKALIGRNQPTTLSNLPTIGDW